MTGLAAATAPASLSGWPGAGAGLAAIGVCAVLGMFAPRLVPRRWNRAHPWLHRLVAAVMYCGACALLASPVGHGIVSGITSAERWPGSSGAWWVHAAVTVAAWFLLLTVALAVCTEPHPRAGWYAVALVLVLALVPGGWMHGILVATSPPGRAAAGAVASWFGGP